jgi:hypothetical protein
MWSLMAWSKRYAHMSTGLDGAIQYISYLSKQNFTCCEVRHNATIHEVEERDPRAG